MSFNQHHQKLITFISKSTTSDSVCSNASGFIELHSIIYKHDIEVNETDQLSKDKNNIERLKEFKAKCNICTNESILINIDI